MKYDASLSAAIVALGVFTAFTCEAKEWPGFAHGMGIGGWLTNYKRFNSLPQK